ncbi:MAG: hypothetical protein JWQ40_2775, partial [Segetibacter sp.]|nr:hypothetical protein [Segetibacter sp.]
MPFFAQQYYCSKSVRRNRSSIVP